MPTTQEEIMFSEITRIAGQNEDYCADVTPRIDGKNALCVDVLPSSVNPPPSILDNGLRLVTNASAITLTTVYQDIINRSGSGLLLGWVLDCNSNSGIVFEFSIDGQVIFTELTFDFITSLYGTNYGANTYLYIGQSDLGDLQFRPPNPIKYNSSIVVRAKRTATNKIVNRSLYWVEV